MLGTILYYLWVTIMILIMVMAAWCWTVEAQKAAGARRTVPPPSLAKQQFHAVEAMRRAGMSEEWIRAFVTFEPEPTPAPKEPPVPGDNAALLAELKNAWESRAQSPLVPIRPACQVRVDNHITLWDVDGNVVGRWEV